MVVAATTLMLLTSNTITGSVFAQKQVYPITAAKAMAKQAALVVGTVVVSALLTAPIIIHHRQ